MAEAMQEFKVLLIGGSSHAGKSFLARSLGLSLGCEWLATDGLARHPGRPWLPDHQSVPTHVADHYLSLNAEKLLIDVLRHYKSMWPEVKDLITAHASNPSSDWLILEGSALWPEQVANLNVDAVRAVWLNASDDLFESRILGDSQFHSADALGQMMIKKFLQRMLRYNAEMMRVVERLGLAHVEVQLGASMDQVSAEVLNCIGEMHD